MTPSTEAVLAALRRLDPSVDAVDAVVALGGGMSREIWSVDVRRGGGGAGAVLRLDPVDVDQGETWARLQVSKAGELAVMQAAHAAGVPVPRPWGLTEATDGLGDGLVMDRVCGETRARRILGDADLAGLARQCGRALARLHAIDATTLDLPRHEPLALWRGLLDDLGLVSPVLEFGFRHLLDRAPPARGPRVVHGDLRLGNLVVDAGGLVAVLDWEAAHLGEPGEDLGWLCAPAFGFGSAEEVLAGYAEAGGSPYTVEELRYWQLFATVRWAVMTEMMGQLHLSGARRSLELALTGRERAGAEATVLELVSDAH